MQWSEQVLVCGLTFSGPELRKLAPLLRPAEFLPSANLVCPLGFLQANFCLRFKNTSPKTRTTKRKTTGISFNFGFCFFLLDHRTVTFLNPCVYLAAVMGSLGSLSHL